MPRGARFPGLCRSRACEPRPWGRWTKLKPRPGANPRRRALRTTAPSERLRPPVARPCAPPAHCPSSRSSLCPFTTTPSVLAETPSSARIMASITPAGLQSTHELTRRRLIVAALNIVTYLGLAWAMVSVLSAGGWTIVDGLMLVCFLFAAPWSVLGFWNSVIGLWLLHATPDPWEETAPFAAAGEDGRLSASVRRSC